MRLKGFGILSNIPTFQDKSHWSFTPEESVQIPSGFIIETGLPGRVFEIPRLSGFSNQLLLKILSCTLLIVMNE